MSDEMLSRIFAALADPTRRDLVGRLAEGDATVGELAAAYPVSVQAISKHLKVLHDAGVITRTGAGRRSPVHLEATIFPLVTKWVDRYERLAEERYRRLDALLDNVQAHTTNDAEGETA